ncbi:hypothetical protein M408DRAFT_36372, partial [Serendipita vermifera MAFF 305830]
MEHVVHFLVGKAEGAQRAKVLLPMYPTKKPADTVSFRNAVVKYFEGLRAVALKPPPAKSGSISRGLGRANQPPSNEDSVKVHGWWWKDVLVRKSLFEECTGARFERLLLSFSIHVLM